MKKLHRMFVLLFLMVSSDTHALEIGHTTLPFVDSSRSRTIETEVYYPADTAGDDVPVTTGMFPRIVFGHGYLIIVRDYEFLWTGLVPEGFIVALPRSEDGILPNHLEFGKDLAFVSEELKALNTDSGSLFYGHVASTSVIMGHSMGGGASFLAIEYAPTVTALANFAAAETSTSAIAAAADITVPALLFSGTEDCITPPADHQIPMYETLDSICKTHITITGASHCGFAQNNTVCVLGETISGCPATIDLDVQENITLQYLIPWLNGMLKKDITAMATFQALLDSGTTDSTITYNQDCVLLEVSLFPKKPCLLFVLIIFSIIYFVRRQGISDRSQYKPKY